MNLEEYSRQQRQISAELVAAVILLLQPFQRPAVNDPQWDSLARALFNLIDNARTESAELARTFFDAQWAQHNNAPAPDVDLPSYFPRYLDETLRPVKRKFQQSDAPDSALTDIADLAMKETESAGRRTVLRGVDHSQVRYARVLTGRENCGFCVMLASRGPVYYSRESAGDPQMREFHKGCDCKVVPVFNAEDWPGREQQRELARMWRNVTKGRSGRDALNALRRYLKEQERESGGASQIPHAA